MAKHYQFDVDSAWQELPEPVQQAVLYGSGEQQINFIYLTEAGGRTVRKHAFEGIIPNLERRFKETESQAVKEELSKFVSMRD